MDYIQFTIAGLTVGAVYALVALGFHLIISTTGILDFAQGEKLVLGGLFALVFISAGLPYPVAFILSIIVAIVLGFLYYRLIILPTSRGTITGQIIATLGASLFFFYGHGLIWGQGSFPFPPITPGELHLGEIVINYQSFWIWGALLVIVLGLLFFLKRTREGKAMVASSTNPTAASAVGINVSRMYMYAFAISFALAVIGGILAAPKTLAGGTIGTSLAIKGFAGAVIGGVGNPVGVVLGSLLVGVLENNVAGAVAYGYRDPAVYITLLLVLMLRPEGLFTRGREVT
jgi:branched-chain amino acid transport system permease protein